MGLIGIADTIKDDATRTIQRVKDTGITPVMLSGDDLRTARSVANQAGIDEVFAEILPEGKASEVRRLQQGGGMRVMMVGDGINDASALTRADIGAAVTGLVSPVWVMIAMISSVTAVLASSFGGRLLRDESFNTRYASLTEDDYQQSVDQPSTVKDDQAFILNGPGLFAVQIDEHTVAYWAGIVGAITLLVGIWWTQLPPHTRGRCSVTHSA